MSLGANITEFISKGLASGQSALDRETRWGQEQSDNIAKVTKALQQLRDIPGSYFQFKPPARGKESHDVTIETNLTYVDGIGMTEWGDKEHPAKITIGKIFGSEMDGTGIFGIGDERNAGLFEHLAYTAKIQKLIPADAVVPPSDGTPTGNLIQAAFKKAFETYDSYIAEKNASISDAFNAYADMTKALAALRDLPGSKFRFQVVHEDKGKGAFTIQTNLTYVDGMGMKERGDKTRLAKISISPFFSDASIEINGSIVEGASTDERLKSAIQDIARRAKMQHLVS